MIRRMKIWPLNNLYFVIFLICGFFATVPFVLGLVGDFWWVAIPGLAAWIAVIWVWGLPFAADSPEAFKSWSMSEKVGGALIMLGQSLVGVVVAVFLLRVLIHEWIATVLAILLMAVLIFWFGREPPKRAGSTAQPHPAKTAAAIPAPAVHHPPATPMDWLLHHVSLLLVLGFGALTLVDQLHRKSLALGWPAAAMTLAYAAFVWIHVVSPPKPGEPPKPIWYKVLATFMTFVMTVVVLIILAVVIEAIGEFWIWIVPPAGLVALVVALNWRAPPTDVKRERPPAKRRGHGQIVN
ncbi:MAG TPA: hypothetical protein VFE13_03375 [Caulobacteraceae bacterium]|jgi:VanZ family protein|nr:hypothetical protein [Caulobacteraceae bacterium]